MIQHVIFCFFLLHGFLTVKILEMIFLFSVQYVFSFLYCIRVTSSFSNLLDDGTEDFGSTLDESVVTGWDYDDNIGLSEGSEYSIVTGCDECGNCLKTEAYFLLATGRNFFQTVLDDTAAYVSADKEDGVWMRMCLTV